MEKLIRPEIEIEGSYVLAYPGFEQGMNSKLVFVMNYDNKRLYIELVSEEWFQTYKTNKYMRILCYSKSMSRNKAEKIKKKFKGGEKITMSMAAKLMGGTW